MGDTSSPPVTFATGPEFIDSHTLLGDDLDKKLDYLGLPPLKGSVHDIVDAAGIKFRPTVEVPLDQIPELLDPSLIDSDSDSGLDADEFKTPFDSLLTVNRHPSAAPSEAHPLIGGARVQNLSLVVPDRTGTCFGDLPVNHIPASEHADSRIIASTVQDGTPGQSLLGLILPLENQSADDAKGWSKLLGPTALPKVEPLKGLSQFITMSKTPMGKTKTGENVSQQKEDMDGKLAEGDPKIATEKVEEYILSGDISNLWGIKGLSGKLYKFKGPEKDVSKEVKKDFKKAKESKTGESNNSAQKGVKTQEGHSDSNHETNTKNRESEKKSEQPDVKKNKDDPNKKKTEKNKEPIREKVKLNPKAVKLAGEPLGTLFPFLEADGIRSLPLESLELTYSDEEKNFLFPPGLRLEADVPFKDCMQWAGDALKKLVGPHDPPQKLHLSAHLSDKRDWSKRPEISKLVLQASLDDLKPWEKSWDFLRFKTMGLELVAEKVVNPASKKNSKKGEKGSGDDQEKSPKEKEDVDKDISGENPEDAMQDTNLAKPEEQPLERQESSECDQDSGLQPQKTRKGLKQKDGKDKRQKDEESDEKKAWYYSFGFYGSCLLTKLPHANSPLELNYRIARDLRVKGGEKKDDKKDKKEENSNKKESDKDAKKRNAKCGEQSIKENETQGSEEEKQSESEKSAGDQKEKKPKSSKPVEHERIWNLVIVSDEWKDVCNIKNLTMSEAKFETSFKEGDFGKSFKLEVSAKMKLGAGSLNVKGKLAKDDYLLSADVGDLPFSDIKKIHAQVTNQKLPAKEEKPKIEEKDKGTRKEGGDEETAGNELIFKKLKLNLSRKREKQKKRTRNALELEGQVTFNEHTSAEASIKIATEGLTITGGVGNFKIPDTDMTVKKAGLLICIAFGKGKEDSKGTKDKSTKDQADAEKITSPEADKTEAKSSGVAPAESDAAAGKTRNEGDNKKVPDTKEKKKATEKEEEETFQSKFAVLGEVSFGDIVFKAGFHVGKEKGAEKREWLAFGAVDNVRLRELWKDIPGDSFLDLNLNNVAVIASSKARTRKDGENKKEEKKKDDDKKEGDNADGKKKEAKEHASEDKKKSSGAKKSDGETKSGGGKKSKDEKKPGDEKVTASWDVLSTIDAYNYPIVKGFQICATVSSFPQLEKLNKGRKVEALKLVLSISPQGKVQASLELPASLRMVVSPEAYLGQFRGSIGLGELGPELSLGATLTWHCKTSEPIKVHGVLVGTFVGLRGQLYMDDKSEWINPFNLNERLKISELGIGTHITWEGIPSSLELSGRIRISEFDLTMRMGVEALTGDALFEFKYPNKLDIMGIVEMAAELTEHRELHALSRSGGKGLVVFEDLLLYLSTGMEFLGKRYERGIQVRGKLDVFGKKGQFDGTFDSNGVVIKAEMDNTKIGGLEIRSTDPKKERAVMDIELTGERQRAFIDGMVRLYSMELRIFIDGDLQKSYLKAEISLKFTDDLYFSVQALIDARTGPLENATIMFEGELGIDFREAVAKGIKNGITALEEAAVRAIEDLKRELDRQIKGKEKELGELELQLKKLEREVNEKVAKMKQKENKEWEEIERLEQEVKVAEAECEKARDAKNRQDKEISEQESKRDEAETRLEKKKLEKYKELGVDVEKNEKDLKEWEEKRRKAEEDLQKEWSDEILEEARAESDWKWWCDYADEKGRWLLQCERELKSCSFWDKAYWIWKLAEAKSGYEWACTRRAIATEIRKACKAALEDPDLKFLKGTIDTCRRITEGMNEISYKLVEGRQIIDIISDCIKGEKHELRIQKAILDDLISKGEELGEKLKEKEAILRRRWVNWNEEKKKAMGRIEELKGEMELVPANVKYREARKHFEQVKAAMDNIQAVLNNVEKGVHLGSEAARQVIDFAKHGFPTLKKVHVRASSQVMKNGDPVSVSFHVEWLGKTRIETLSWNPGGNPADLYQRVANKVVTGGEEVSFEPLPNRVQYFMTSDQGKKMQCYAQARDGTKLQLIKDISDRVAGPHTATVYQGNLWVFWQETQPDNKIYSRILYGRLNRWGPVKRLPHGLMDRTQPYNMQAYVLGNRLNLFTLKERVDSWGTLFTVSTLRVHPSVDPSLTGDWKAWDWKIGAQERDYDGHRTRPNTTRPFKAIVYHEQLFMFCISDRGCLRFTRGHFSGESYKWTHSMIRLMPEPEQKRNEWNPWGIHVPAELDDIETMEPFVYRDQLHVLTRNSRNQVFISTCPADDSHDADPSDENCKSRGWPKTKYLFDTDYSCHLAAIAEQNRVTLYFTESYGSSSSNPNCRQTTLELEEGSSSWSPAGANFRSNLPSDQPVTTVEYYGGLEESSP